VSIALLDVNVLVAMVWQEHIHHDRVRRWRGALLREDWATCPLTEAGFVRVSVQPHIGGVFEAMQNAFRALERNCAEAQHVFWPQDSSVTHLLPEIRERLVGHQQLSDAILLDLAIRKGGRLATLDRRVLNLLPADSPHRRAIELIPASENL
jgi:toxin-antitoxin system PIN domain toxin